MKHFLYFALAIVLTSACNNTASKNNHTPPNALDSFLKTQKADFAISVIGPDGLDTFETQANKHMIMMSVVKFPQAIALLNLVDQGQLSLDSIIVFDSLSLKRDTWSPFAEEHPYGDAKMTLRECFNYSVGKSDNIVCDRLYELLSFQDVTAFVNQLGLKDFGIASNYKNLDVEHLERNFTSAHTTTILLKMIADGKILSDASRKLLLDVMKATETGEKRLRGLLPKDVMVAHKTGTFYQKDSFVNCVNDVGIVYLPNGKYYCISVLVNNSYLGGDGTEKAIAVINKIYYEYYLRKK